LTGPYRTAAQKGQQHQQQLRGGPPTGDFRHITGSRKIPKTAIPARWEGSFIQFNQNRFCPNDDRGSIGMDSTA
jgi:hypothetical protein